MEKNTYRQMDVYMNLSKKKRQFMKWLNYLNLYLSEGFPIWDFLLFTYIFGKSVKIWNF